MGGILWLYQTQGLFMICAPGTDVTKTTMMAVHKQRVTKNGFMTAKVLTLLKSVIHLFFILLPGLKHGTSVTIPLRSPEYVNFFEPFQPWPVIHLVVPIGVSHISSWLQEIQSREWEKRAKNKRTIWAWVNSSARRLSCDTLHSFAYVD